MLKQLIVIDYIEGAGGEYLANFLNGHAEFYKEGTILENLQNSNDVILKFFNLKSITRLDWEENFLDYLEEYKKLCLKENITRVAVPYHLYKFPHHVQLLSSLAKSVRFIKINTLGFEELITYDFLRKVMLKKISKKDIKQFSLLVQNLTNEDKKELTEQFKKDNLLFLDLYDKQKITVNEKVAKIFKDSYKKSLPSNDVIINYRDFFINFDCTTEIYFDLCNKLEITPDEKLVRQLIKRNTQNYISLVDYIKEFNYE